MKDKKILYFLALAGCALLIILFILYRSLFSTITVPDKNARVIYIPTGSSFEQVMDTLEKRLVIKDKKTFIWLAIKKHYPSSIKPGRFLISEDQSYLSLINLLRSGRQSPVKITFSNLRTLNQIAGRIGRQIEADSALIMNFLSDETNYQKDGFNRENIISLFIPNTYELYWNTSASDLYYRILKEYNLFWNTKRLSEAREKGLDRIEVSILASIIDDEVTKTDEKPRIAGVYLNRLKRGIPLQSCPTIKFAMNDFSITRILKKYLTIDSPYNTYIHAGFPPGPIGCASIEGIDAVLNAENHDFLFFAAKADFSGYHNFSRTLAEHNRYALMYQRELDKRKIFR